jgi:hypothetical protein
MEFGDLDGTIRRIVKRVVRSRGTGTAMEQHILSMYDQLVTEGHLIGTMNQETRIGILTEKICEALMTRSLPGLNHPRQTMDTIRHVDLPTVSIAG